MVLRKPRKKELKKIVGALKYYNSLSFLEDKVLLVREGKKKEVFAMSKHLYDFLLGNNFLNSNYYYLAGIKIGEVGRRFRFSLEGSYWLVKNDKKKVWVNEKGEMLFLYGRDIFASSIEKAGEFEENEIIFVCNSDGDVIGIGKSRVPSRRIFDLEGDRVAVENLVDRGEYIRHSKLYDCF